MSLGVGSNGTRDGSAVPPSAAAFHDSPWHVLRAAQALDEAQLAEERRRQAARDAAKEELALVRSTTS